MPLLQDVLRAYFREMVALVGGNKAKFSRQTGIPKPDLSNLLKRQPTKRVTTDMLEKVHRGKDLPWSSVFQDLARIALRMEATEELPVDMGHGLINHGRATARGGARQPSAAEPDEGDEGDEEDDPEWLDRAAGGSPQGVGDPRRR